MLTSSDIAQASQHSERPDMRPLRFLRQIPGHQMDLDPRRSGLLSLRRRPVLQQSLWERVVETKDERTHVSDL